MALRGEVHHRARLVLRQNRVDGCTVTDVGALERIPQVAIGLASVFGLAA